jgi:glycerate 2-kinase
MTCEVPASEDALRHLRATARAIFAHALAACGVEAAFDRHLRIAGSILTLPSGPVDLSASRVIVIALGKAAVPMLQALLRRLPPALPVEGVCVGPQRPDSPGPHQIAYYAGGHPLPNADSFEAARRALRLLGTADPETFVFFLVSGGGSALFELPLDPSISLEDTIAFHRILVGCGGTIAEINTVRKHFSAVKGGRLAAAAGRARTLTLQIADVPAAHLDALASAPTLPDSSTLADCRAVLARYDLEERFPAAVRACFADPALPETPKPNSPGADAPVLTLLSNEDLLRAAADEARRRGFSPVIDNTCDDWDYRDAATYLLRRFAELRGQHARPCLLSGGEVTVRLPAEPGQGGRNQQFALACALDLQQLPSSAQPAIAVLSAGTDGIDGNSPAAGAVADSSTATRAGILGLDPIGALSGFNAWPIFRALDDALMTGPTGNNLRDLRLLIGA